MKETKKEQPDISTGILLLLIATGGFAVCACIGIALSRVPSVPWIP